MTLTDLSTLPPIDHQLGSDPTLLLDEIKHIIATQIDAHPRSQQTRLGPSEIGDPCARRLAYKLLGIPKARTLSTPWRPTVGTAVHAWLEEAFATWNAANREAMGGASRFLLETHVDAGTMAGDQLTGHSDAYDRVTQTVIDWKIIGPSSHKKLRADISAGRGPRREYRDQLHTYGRGYVLRGLPVARVALVGLPVAGELDDALMWCEDYDRAIAEKAMARVDRIHALTSTLGAAALTVTDQALHDAGITALCGDPGSAAAGFAGERLALELDEGECRFCPWLAAGSDDPTTGCPGADPRANTKHLQALIAV